MSYHGWEDICQSASEFKHDDHHRDGNVHDTAQGCARTKESIRSRRDTWYVWLTGCKESGVGKGIMQSLDKYTDHSSKRCPYCHGGNKDAGGYLAAVGYNNEESPHDGCKEEG